MTVHLPLWHSHCTRARFTLLAWSSDQLVSVPFRAKVVCEAFVRTLLLLFFIV